MAKENESPTGTVAVAQELAPGQQSEVWTDLSEAQKRAYAGVELSRHLEGMGLELDLNSPARANTRRWLQCIEPPTWVRKHDGTEDMDTPGVYAETRRQLFVECSVISPSDGLSQREIHVSEGFSAQVRSLWEQEAEIRWENHEGWRVDASNPA